MKKLEDYKKINNNVAIALDGNQRECVVFGKGIGFHEMPYELKDLSKIDQTFYNVDSQYYNILNEIPDEIFLLVSRLLEVAKSKIGEKLNPNLPFILADHINFAIERKRKGMDFSMSYSYELEYEYPELTKVSVWFVKKINEKAKVQLEDGEITCVLMHFLNALEQPESIQKQPLKKQLSYIIQGITEIIESYFDIVIDKKSFHYFRFKNHIKFFIQRKERGEEFHDANEELFRTFKESSPDVYQCVLQIDDYLFKEFGERCPEEELLYLMMHVNQLYRKEDCNRKGITPKE